MENTIIKSINLFSHIKNDDVFKIFDLAEKNKFNIWIVGGAIRDFFLKSPMKIISQFSKCSNPLLKSYTFWLLSI